MTSDLAMDPEKPFKTIEVIDSRTKQVCKVACMSCIRGHRTTACGIPVCRPKIFWTVKRPGRPSNSCTCRYGASGNCKCVVARTACPHKSKKGEKRSGGCRCDEQGRFCCLLEPEHWDALVALRKPTVDFYSSPEALEAGLASINMPQFLRTPSYSVVSPQLLNGSSEGAPAMVPSPPLQQDYEPTAHMTTGAYDSLLMGKATLTPRFGMMGIGAPQGSLETTSDVLSWQGETPLAPREFRPQELHEFPSSLERSSGGQSSAATTPGIKPQALHLSNPFEQGFSVSETATLDAFTGPDSVLPSQALVAPAFDFDRLQMEYSHYQFPSAICQNCGLSGCSCKNCPPVFQNFGTTSWAQCCGRKHARESPPRRSPEPTRKVARVRIDDNSTAVAQAENSTSLTMLSPALDQYRPLTSYNSRQDYLDPKAGDRQPLTSDATYEDLSTLELENPLVMASNPGELDISEFLITDLDRPDQQKEGRDPGGGCCCGES